MQARRLNPTEAIKAAGIASVSLDPWQVQLPLPLTFLWSHHDTVASGFGEAASREPLPGDSLAWLDDLPSVESTGALSVPGPWFGGVSFDRVRPARRGWEGFPSARFVVPRILVLRQNDACTLWAFSSNGDAQEVLDRARRQMRVRPAQTEAGYEVELDVHSDRDAWNALVEEALAEMQRGGLQKVVAARCLEVSAASALDPVRCAERLRKDGGPAAAFLIKGGSGASFVGATPERLVALDGTTLRTQALASSARPSQSTALTREAKEQREHSAVVQDIRRALAPLSTRLDVAPEPRLLELPYISHLQTPIEATLREGVGLSQVLESMFPTAAVGGTPRQAALEFIRAHEGWDRGWYAGAIGWVGPKHADLHVAIRSALIEERRARVFVGAGLVVGSDPEREWQETEDKARPMLRALGESGVLS